MALLLVAMLAVGSAVAQPPPAVSTSSSPAETPAPPAAPQASATSPADDPVIEPPRALGPLDVAYPEDQTDAARVVVELYIDAAGVVQEAQAIDGSPAFAAAAETAAKSWRFAPARRDGQAVAARIRVQVEFEPPVLEEIELPAAEPAAQPDAAAELPQGPPPAGEVGSVDVVVKGERVVGVKRLGKADVRQMPGAFGDPFRAIEALPGVTPIATGLPYFFIRGAPPGNIGYFFDGIPVPLLFHVGAGPGVIHPAFISSVDLYSGAYPVRFGRFAGGIVSGEAEQPAGRFRGEASIRLVDSGAFVEVPFAEGKGSAMLAGRYSYTGLVISLLADDVTLGYWDYQSRVRYDLSPTDTVSIFAFGSHDYLSAAGPSGGPEQELLDLTFHRIDTRYTRHLSGEAKLDLTLSWGYDLTGLGGDPDSEQQEDIATLTARTLGARIDYQNRLAPRLLWRAGSDARFIRYSTDLNIPEDDDDDEFQGEGRLTGPELERRAAPAPGFPELVLDPLDALEDDQALDRFDTRFLSRDDLLAGVWTDAVIDAGAGVTITPGLRLDMYDNAGEVTLAFEPRIATRFDVSKTVSLTHDLGIAHQPPSFAIPIPGLGGAASDGLQRSIQSSAGVETQLPSDVTASVTLFQNVTLNSTDLFSVANLEDSDPNANTAFDRTTAHSYGMEVFLRRSLAKRLGGLLSYTLSRSTRSVPRLSGVSSFDRRHTLNLALAYDLGRRWRLAGRAFVYSGIPAEVAYPEAVASPQRGPWFYRVDWRLEKRWLLGTQGAWWAFVAEVLNTTLNKETLNTSCYAYGCRENAIGPVTIPSIGVEASF